MKFNTDPNPDISDDQLESQLLWIIGAPRTGSTWLANRLLRHDLIRLWDEPLIGRLFGMMSGGTEREHERNIHFREGRPQFVFSQQAQSIWKEAVRNFILTQVRLRYPGLRNARCRLAIKEPNGSEGADIALAALPQSKLCLLIRDPRDIMDSLLDLHHPDSIRPTIRDEADRREWVRIYSQEIHNRLEASLKAFKNHPSDRKVLVAYETLRQNTKEELGKIYRLLGIEVDDRHLELRVQRFSFENLPERFRGHGKQARFAQVGRWRSALTDADQEVMEPLLGSWIRRFGAPSQDGA